MRKQQRPSGPGRSRPHGHLLPETLTAHLGLISAPTLRAARIMRLTVHPALQRRGLGSRLVNEVTERASGQGYDYVGTSFGATVRFARVLAANGLVAGTSQYPERCQQRQSFCSVAQTIGHLGTICSRTARQRFFAQFPDQLSDSLRTLEPALVIALLKRADNFHRCWTLLIITTWKLLPTPAVLLK